MSRPYCLALLCIVMLASTSAFAEEIPNPSFESSAAAAGEERPASAAATKRPAAAQTNPWSANRQASNNAAPGTKPYFPAKANASSNAKATPQAPAQRKFDPNAKPIVQKLGKGDADKASALSQTAETEDDYTKIISLCKSGMQKGLETDYVSFTRKLCAWSYNRRGELRADSEQMKEAFDDFDAAVALDSKQWRAIHNRGVSYAMLGNATAAIADFGKTIEINPKFANAWFNRGEMLYEKRDFAAAVRDYSQSLKLSPEDASALNSRGHAYYRLQRHAEALADYNKAIQVDPSSAAALVNRGDLQSEQGNYAAAAADYRAAIKANPSMGRAYQSAAWLMATCPDENFRNSELGIEAAQKAIELDGDADYRYLETLAASQANAGEFDLAIESQQKAMENAPAAVTQIYKGRVEKFRAGHAHREQNAKFASGSAAAARR